VYSVAREFSGEYSHDENLKMTMMMMMMMMIMSKCKNEADTNNNRENWKHLKINQKVSEQHTWKPRH
jgi:hypothetical protein